MLQRARGGRLTLIHTLTYTALTHTRRARSFGGTGRDGRGPAGQRVCLYCVCRPARRGNGGRSAASEYKRRESVERMVMTTEQTMRQKSGRDAGTGDQSQRVKTGGRGQRVKTSTNTDAARYHILMPNQQPLIKIHKTVQWPRAPHVPTPRRLGRPAIRVGTGGVRGGTGGGGRKTPGRAAPRQ